MFAQKSFRDANGDVRVPGDKMASGDFAKKVWDSYERRGLIGKKKPDVVNTSRNRQAPKPAETKPAKPEEVKK